MKEYTDEVRQERIENCKLMIRKLGDPQFASVSELNNQTSELPIRIRSASLFDVRMDPRVIITLLRAFGVTDEIKNTKIEIDFRLATLADRNLVGDSIGGLRSGDAINGYQVEIYTSLPGNTQEKNVEVTIDRTIQIHFATNAHNLASAIVEELRHVSQEINHEFDSNHVSSFNAESYEEFMKIDYEKDAAEYVRLLSKLVEQFIMIQAFDFDSVHDWYEIEETERTKAYPNKFSRYLRKDLAAKVFDKDPVGMYLLDQINQAPSRPDEEFVSNLVARIQKYTDERKIGFLEARYLLKKLKEKMINLGFLQSIDFLDQSISYYL